MEVFSLELVVARKNTTGIATMHAAVGCKYVASTTKPTSVEWRDYSYGVVSTTCRLPYWFAIPGGSADVPALVYQVSLPLSTSSYSTLVES